MEEFNYINTFFNIIEQNESAYMRDLFSSYQYKEAFCQWLSKRLIDVPMLKSIDKEDFYMLSANMKAIDIDCILHIPFFDEMQNLSKQYQNCTHILLIPGFENCDQFHVDFNQYKDVYFYEMNQLFQKSDLSFFDPFSAFFTAMNHADLWPGVLIFNENNAVFTPIASNEDMQRLFKHIDHHDNLFEIYDCYEEDCYFIQLSDLHLGRDKREKGLTQLLSSLEWIIPQLHAKQQVHFLITGDLMESPNRKNMYLANDFMNELKKKYKADVTFILGNHDVIVHGFNFARNQKSKVIAYLLGENIKVLEKEKVILIKMDTTSEGNLARGMVGQRQLDEIDDELAAIENIEDYTMIVMLHQHVYPITKAQFIKTKWHEKTFINKIVETSKVLVDAPLLIDWLEKRKIKYVFHGHKHLPFFRKENGCYYVSAGSSTGGLKESKSRYISYNIMKYNTKEKVMKTCMIFYDDKSKAERQRVEVYLYGEDKDENSR